VLHNFLGPVGDAGVERIPRGAATLLGYVFVVVVVNRLGAQRRRLAELTLRQRDELAEEIQLAAEVQQNILPRSIPTVAGVEFAARMYPAKIVAGDYYGFLELADGQIGLVIADVSGKGVAAGLLMPCIEVALRMDAPRFPRTNDLLENFNDVVHQLTSGDRFISLFYGKLRPGTRSLEYTNAGHNPPLVIRGCQDPIPLDKGGPVLGVVPGSRYDTEQIDLRTGDVLVLFTDGVVEAQNPAGEEYSAKRLSGIVSSHLQRSAGELIETIRASVVEFRGTPALADDLTLVVLKIL
jgi:sigma-B regulation protein RsbU (phosphoserine phosphatase)